MNELKEDIALRIYSIKKALREIEDERAELLDELEDARADLRGAGTP